MCNFIPNLLIMKYLTIISFICIGLFLYCCKSTPIFSKKTTTDEQPVVIANDSLAYKIIIFDQGFNTYLNTIAKPVGFYSQNYLENKNSFYVSIWNLRVNSPFTYNPNIYENIINYNSNVNYGYDVNYKLFNYFEFAQRKYTMRLQ